MSSAEYRRVFGLFKHYHRAAMTLATVSLARAVAGLVGTDVVPVGWLDGIHCTLCVLGTGYVVAPYTQRFIEMITLVRDRS